MTDGVGLATIAREWGRIGCIGFGGPPAHISLLRDLCVTRRKWLGEAEFEEGVAATNLLPGPASTQLAILCAWRLRGTAGALVGGFCFIVPGLVLILALAALFLATDPPAWVLGAAAGAGAAVPAVALHAAWGLLPASRRRAGAGTAPRVRWVAYLVAGGVAAAVTGPWLVLVLIAAGVVEVAVGAPPGRRASWPVVLALPAASGGLLAVAWVAAKVGALSYGGGFVIIPLMRQDAVHTYGWMTDGQFLNAVALGQVTPGPVVHTVAVVGYAAAGLVGGLLAAVVAFAPSFVLVVLTGPRLERLRHNGTAQAFLTGAGAAAIGAIAGSTLPLAASLHEGWQFAVLAAAVLWLLALRRGVVGALLAAGAVGALVALL
ncbi:chromate efflux transporter [Saccharothrix australiensis]|uniref:Chromate transporter n=1 Tax=Saccharothrix australiensis TaxID=2072 RepID=A0A495W8Q5_9PSEU|nr:chromate efflux transporter [Saccharothrix australiensis]RKT56158.1 chromate transporter [Saccharothrix australiensis]